MAQCEGVCLYILFQCLISVHKLTPASYGAVIWLGSVIPTEIGGYQKWTLVKEMICNAIPLCLFKDSSSYWSLFLRQFFIIFSLSTILMTHKYAVVFPIFKGNNLDSMFHSSCLYNKLSQELPTQLLYLLTSHFLLKLLVSQLIAMKCSLFPSSQ